MISQILVKFCQSDEILPNLVTLVPILFIMNSFGGSLPLVGHAR